MELQMLAQRPHVTGSRATIKAVERGEAEAVFVAADAEKRFTQPVKDACVACAVPLMEIPTMVELGRAACLQVAASAAAVLKSN